MAHPEEAYLSLLTDVVTNGKLQKNRTGIDTLSIWGKQLTIDLSQGFPLLTTKHVWFKGMLQELLFFVSGKTDSKILEKEGVGIWKGNTTRQFLDSRGLTSYQEGEMGPMYGFQWRHSGAEYKANHQYKIGEAGIDQLQNIIDAIRIIKLDPTDSRARRLILTAWNPSDIDKMCLAPCHYSIQFSVDGNRLNCLVSMRSSDLFLGLPWNLNYAILVHMICHLTDLQPGKLVYSLADCHLYVNTLDQTKLQLSRSPKVWPTLEITKKHNSIDEFTVESFKLNNYEFHPAIKAEMAV